jgi:hypothetical protein
VSIAARVSFDVDFSTHFLDVRYQRIGFVLLGAFLCTFLFIRTSARLIRSPRVPWWPGSVTTGSGLHLHHLVWGIVLMMITGFAGFITPQRSPATELIAAGFGIGIGLTLDEFALWIYLRDVYWEEEGRKSFDAVVVATVIGGLIVLGVAPFDLPNNTSSLEALAFTVLIDVALAAAAILKGRYLLGLVGIFVPFASVIGAVRLATPDSAWARRFYSPEGSKLSRSRARFARQRNREKRLADAIAGAPESTAEKAVGGD